MHVCVYLCVSLFCCLKGWKHRWLYLCLLIWLTYSKYRVKYMRIKQVTHWQWQINYHFDGNPVHTDLILIAKGTTEKAVNCVICFSVVHHVIITSIVWSEQSYNISMAIANYFNSAHAGRTFAIFSQSAILIDSHILARFYSFLWVKMKCTPLNFTLANHMRATWIKTKGLARRFLNVGDLDGATWVLHCFIPLHQCSFVFVFSLSFCSTVCFFCMIVLKCEFIQLSMEISPTQSHYNARTSRWQ